MMPREPDVEKEFPFPVIGKAWRRQGGKCARCGTKLVVANQDKGTVGAWHAHPRFRGLSYNLDDNCVLFCINPPNNCHWIFGHGGYDERHYPPLEDWELPFFYAGTRRNYPSREFRQALRDLRSLRDEDHY